MTLNMYSVLLLLSAVNLVLLYVLGRKQNYSLYVLLFGSITVSLMGTYAVSTAESMEAALVGHRFIYAGGVFAPVFMALAVARLCKIKIPHLISVGLMLFSIVILYFSFNIDTQTIYYSSMHLEQYKGMTHIIREYGPAHILYPIFLAINVLSILGIVIYSHVWKKNVTKKISAVLFAMDISTITLYFVQKIFDIPLDIFTISYIISEVIILILIRRIGMYEVSESIAASIEENSTYGYIILDRKLRYLSCNDTARTFLAEVTSLKTDCLLSEDNAPILHSKLTRWFDNPEQIFSFSIQENDRYLRCSTKKLFYGGNNQEIGYYIELVDTTQQQRYVELMDNYNTTLKNDVAAKTYRIEMLQDKLILGMSDIIESRDSNTGGHVKRTSLAIRIFTDELKKHTTFFGFNEQFLDNVAKAAPMHDLGKIAVQDVILRKPGKFSSVEFEEMKTHSEKGAKIVTQMLDGLEDKEFFDIAVNIAHYHHEKWNGKGYPSKLAGKAIPIEARIMALVDVFDALVSKRCYKEKMNFDDAFHIIEESLGTHFDPDLGELFLKCRLRLEQFYNGIEEKEK